VPGLPLERFYELHAQAKAGDIDGAAQVILDAYTTDAPTLKPGDGMVCFQGGNIWSKGILANLLRAGLIREVAALLWGKDQFNIEPESVQRVWAEFEGNSQCIILGAGSMGKSYSLGARLLLDWLEDPAWTCVKVVSVTMEHALRNVFAHMKALHKASAIPLPGNHLERSIQVNNDDRHGIHLIAIPKGESGAGKLQGLHPKPRPKPHPKFGTMSRIRAILDEAEEIPEGVWADIDNMLISKDGVEHIKVFCATNPRNKRSKLGQLAEPKEGWQSISADRSMSWMSRLGWKVIRLDGARCENVVQRRVVFPGLLTWEGYQNFLAKGEHDPEYWTMGRGFYPSESVQGVVVSESLLNSSIGHLIWKGRPKPIGGNDTALEGGDDNTYVTGLIGEAIGWKPVGTNQSVMFDKPQISVQVDQVMVLPKGDTVAMAKEVHKRSQLLQVEPEQLGCDRNGNGAGVHDYLKTLMGPGVFGFNASYAPSESKMFEDDKQTCKELYGDMTTEMMFAIRRYMEFGMLKISPNVDLSKLAVDLTDRRYVQIGRGRLQCEKKSDFKKRNGRSPDGGDSLGVLIFVARQQPSFSQVMNIKPIDQQQMNRQPLRHSVVDTWETVDFNSN